MRPPFRRSTPGRFAQWLRLAAALAGVALCIVVPFALWGDGIARAAPGWLGPADHAAWFAALGIALLVADVLLPIPGSAVGMALCWTLGPLWGGASLAAGLTLSFAAGYALGRLLPEYRIRRWVGAPLWDAMCRQACHYALWWIVAARPLPVLAEMSALLAGVWRVPASHALLVAALSSCGVAALYAGTVWLGMNEPGVAFVLPATLALPALAWTVQRVLVRRLAATSIGLLAAAPMVLTAGPPSGAHADRRSGDDGGRTSGALVQPSQLQEDVP